MKETILIAIIVIIIYLFLFHNKKNIVLVDGRDNKNKYLVYDDKSKKDAAVLLGDITENMFKLRDYLYENIKDYEEFDQYIRQLHRNLNKDRSLIYENDPHSQLTSFSVNKGEEIAFCLKSKKTGQIHQLNLLMYVALHEMAHIACPEIGHGDLFKKIFKFLTEIAIKINIYQLDNYDEKPVEYCGMMLSSSII
uniref:WLM domain-containing protein n=1 Tax=viral metagenome TaxID=1070528 RepID=A0A6C0DC46_9ZZZZ